MVLDKPRRQAVVFIDAVGLDFWGGGGCRAHRFSSFVRVDDVSGRYHHVMTGGWVSVPISNNPSTANCYYSPIILFIILSTLLLLLIVHWMTMTTLNKNVYSYLHFTRTKAESQQQIRFLDPCPVPSFFLRGTGGVCTPTLLLLKEGNKQFWK